MHDRVGVGSYVGLALVALSTLMLQILLTRVFSVTMAYHSAFMVVSMAMFGLTVGGIVVYLWPGRFTPERAKLQICWNTLLFAATTVAGFAIYLRLPGAPGAVRVRPPRGQRGPAHRGPGGLRGRGQRTDRVRGHSGRT